MKHVLFFFFLVLAAGIALGRAEPFLSSDPSVSAGAAAALLASGWLLTGTRRVFAAVVVTACLAIGVLLAATSPNAALEKKWEAAVKVAAAGRDTPVVLLEGVVSEGRRAWIDSYGRGRYSFTMDRVVPASARNLALPGRVRVSGQMELPRGFRGQTVPEEALKKLPAYGDRVLVRGAPAVPAGRTNPAGFDWRKFLTARGTFAVMRAEDLRILGPSRGFRSGVLSLRETLLRRMDAAFTPDTADIAKAIFLGERSELDPDFRRSLVNTGTLHLFAISGFNVGFVALILFGCFTLARVPNPWKSLTVLAILTGYAVLVGDNSPVVRAVIMAGCLIAADLLKTRISALQALGIAGAGMLAANPEECFDPAFQLSFAAVAGLAAIVPLWGAIEDVRRARSDRPLARWYAVLTVTVLTSLAAWVTTAPVLIHHFNRFSLAAPVVNVLLVPVAFVLNLLLMIFSAAACIVPAAGGFLAPPVELNVWALKKLVEAFDRLPGASWNLASWSVWTWALFGAWWIWLARRRTAVRRTLRVALSAAVLMVLIGGDAARAAAVLPPLRVTFFDAGQANAALVELGSTRLVIDTGRGGDADAAARILVPYLASIGASRVDAVFITHPQFDHAGGLEGLLRDVEIGGVWTNGDRADAAFFDRALREARRKKVPVRVLKRGDRLEVEGRPAADLTVLHPPAHFPNGGDLNERSLVLRLDGYGKKFLWTGDIGEAGLAQLLSRRKPEVVDVLQVPHHGSRTGVNGLEFLNQVRPGAAVISCGRENRYGHPHPSTLDALAQTARRTHRTDRDGAFRWTADASGRVQTESFS